MDNNSKKNNKKIGTCGFHCLDKENNSIEIGYDLQPDFWKKGYMSEAIEEMIDYARKNLQINKIKACIAEHNTNSIKLITKLGFIKTNNKLFLEFHNKKYLHYIYQLDL